jgi:hypothetical protein
MKLHTVHLRINDQESGQPTPCRIRISDPSGNEYAPFGRSLNFSTNRGEDVGGHVRLGNERWFSMGGTCEIAVPPGELRVQVRKGLDHLPLDQVINQPAGKMSIRLSLERRKLIDKPRVMTIDMRCHFSNPHAAALDAAAEGVDIVNLLAEPTSTLGQDGNVYDSVPNLLAFSGQSACLEKHGAKIIVNTRHRHPMLGSLGLLHCHRVAYPLSFGGPDATDDWSLRDWAGQCHRKDGLVVWTEPFAPNKPHAGEALALAILGEIDAYELTPDNFTHALRGWYQLLNAGITLPLVGSSGRMANNRPIGAFQTISLHAEDHWLTPLKLGAGNVSNGPVCNVSLDGNKVYSSAESLTQFAKVELVANGRVVASEVCHDLFLARFEHVVPEPGWVAVRVIDTVKSPLDNETLLFGHTSAQWIGEPRTRLHPAEFLTDHLRKARDWVDTEGRFDDPNSKVKLLDTFAEAMAKLENKRHLEPESGI